MKNFWTEFALKIMENELLLVRNSPNTKSWFNQMPSKISAICPQKNTLSNPHDFTPVVGFTHHMRLTRLGIEGVLYAPRKFHRYSYYILYDKGNKPDEPFWLILRKG